VIAVAIARTPKNLFLLSRDRDFTIKMKKRSPTIKVDKL
jgi:hypothetical protein